jgi:predicted permease
MLDPVLPIAIYLLFGYLFKIIFQDNSKQLVDFIIYFSLPAIVFSKIYPLSARYKNFMAYSYVYGNNIF